jgi:D-glycero-D-manno-heptose 1,7-bisphosphate phosphatase
MAADGALARAVFLDRDGVINHAAVIDGIPHAPATPEELRILPGVDEALHKLKKAGFFLIVATNQPDVVRGRMSRAAVEAINRRLLDRLCLDAIEVCFHDDADACSCRKPQPGMLRAGAERFGVDLTRSYMVGDRWRDIEAGRRAGCATILIGSGHGDKFPSPPDATFDSLTAAADWIVAAEARQERAS